MNKTEIQAGLFELRRRVVECLDTKAFDLPSPFTQESADSQTQRPTESFLNPYKGGEETEIVTFPQADRREVGKA